MTFRKITALIFCGSLFLNLQPFAAAQKASKTARPKYNILFIIADDLRPELGTYGNPIVKTPNIDKIAARGTRFDRAYAQYPLCNPSRSSLLNGRYPTQTGVMNNNDYFRRIHPDFVTLPQFFKEHGYSSLRSGKIFHGGIDDEVSWSEGGEPTDPAITERGKPGAAPPRQSTLTTGAGGAENQSDRIVVLDGDGESHGDYKTATRAIDFLDRYKDKPFFLAVGFVKPHSPPTAPKKFFDLYDAKKIPLPVDFSSLPKSPSGFPEISIPPRSTDLFIGREASPAAAREMIRAYYASVSFMDAQVGRVMDELVKLGLDKNTIVVFWGDHGYHLGEKGKWSKAYSMWNIGLRVPLIIAMPKAKPQHTTRVVELIDLYRTLADLCGLPSPNEIEGRSFARLLKDPTAKWKYSALSITTYRNSIGKSVITDRWHYVEWDDGKSGTMLLDLENDPFELKNLADDPKYASVVDEMKKLLSQMPKGN
jgi:arylsulfatase A-like enzyme